MARPLSAAARVHVTSQDDTTPPVHEHEVYLLITEALATELLAGRVPEAVKGTYILKYPATHNGTLA